MQVCADDKKNSSCCTTPPLKKTFSDDWSSNDLEQWGPDYFGACKDFKFLVRRGLDVTIEKNGKSALAVTSLFIEADGVTSNPKLRLSFVDYQKFLGIFCIKILQSNFFLAPSVALSVVMRHNSSCDYSLEKCCAGLLKGSIVGDSRWQRIRQSPKQTFVAPGLTAMRGSRRSKWQLGLMEPTV